MKITTALACLFSSLATSSAIALPVYEDLETRCNHLHATFNFDGPPRYPILDFVNFTIVTPTAGGGRPYDTFIPHSKPNVAYSDPKNPGPPDGTDANPAVVTVPEGATYTFTLRSFYFAGQGSFAILLGFRGNTTDTTSLVISPSSQGPALQFVNLVGSNQWSGLTSFALLDKNGGQDVPFVLDDVAVEQDCS